MSDKPNLVADLTPLPKNPPVPGRRVYVETYGCQMNTYDSQVIVGKLEAVGFAKVDDHHDADLVLLNTCSVRDQAEHRVISRVGELRTMHEKAGKAPVVMGVCGCMAERMRDDLMKQKHRVDLIIGVDSYDQLPDLALAQIDGPEATPEMAVGHDTEIHHVAPIEAYPTNNSHLVTIHKGCDYKCTYCIVPYTRGPQSEKRPGIILDEIRRIVDKGGEEVTLLGQNVTAYKWEDQLDFAGLLEQVAKLDGLKRIRFLTGHPCDMHEHLMDLIGQESTICPWLHIPAQSGSDRVLRRMKRYYKRDEYLHMVEYARKVIPDVTFSGDFIVGFPGETDADFQETLTFLHEVRNDAIFSFRYSERPGVPAVKMGDDVTLEVKKARLAELMAVQEGIWTSIADAQIGQEWLGVVEQPARKPEGHWRLRTANNRKIIVPLDQAQPGAELRVKITGWQNTAFLGKVLG